MISYKYFLSTAISFHIHWIIVFYTNVSFAKSEVADDFCASTQLNILTIYLSRIRNVRGQLTNESIL